jgi:glycosyltransferase involved in cell wall biosynthesis
MKKLPLFQKTVFILAGRLWTGEMREFCRSARLENSVVEAVRVSDQNLCALYSGAEALLYPSWIEGFGWPILEAQACGCPVITTNLPPMTEVAGEAAIFIDPALPSAAAEIIAEQWSNRTAMCEAGFKNLQRFNYDRIGDEYQRLYQEIANQHLR